MFFFIYLFCYNNHFSCDKNCPPSTIAYIKNINSNYHIECTSSCDGIIYRWSVCFDDSECKIFQTGTETEFQLEANLESKFSKFYIIVAISGESPLFITFL